MGRPPLIPEGKRKPGRPNLGIRRLPTIIKLTLEGLSRKEIAAEISAMEGQEVSTTAIDCCLYRLRKSGKLSDTEDRLTNLAAPLATDVIIDRLKEGDKGIAVETLKGLGLFRVHSAQRIEGGQPVQALQVVFQDAPRDIAMKKVNIVGQPQSHAID